MEAGETAIAIFITRRGLGRKSSRGELGKVKDSGEGWTRRFLHHDASTAAATRVAILLFILVLHAPGDATPLGEVGASC